MLDGWLASDKVSWIIAGGEIGGSETTRQMQEDWALGLRDQAAASGISFFFKQWGRN
jgi:protein gp37